MNDVERCRKSRRSCVDGKPLGLGDTENFRSLLGTIPDATRSTATMLASSRWEAVRSCGSYCRRLNQDVAVAPSDHRHVGAATRTKRDGCCRFDCPSRCFTAAALAAQKEASIGA